MEAIIIEIIVGENSRIIELFLSLRKDFNYTFIIATHNKLLAKKSDRVLEIKDGKIK